MRLYLTSAVDRLFLVPAERELPEGQLSVVTITGEERRVDAAAIAAYEVTREQAQMYLRTEAERALAGVIDTLARALGVASEQPPDLKRLAARLGLAGGDRQAADAALRGLAADVQAIRAAIASAQPADLDAPRGRLEARGFDLGEALDDLAHQLEEIRRLNQQAVANAAVSGVRVLIDATEGDSEQALGRRIDELIARLEGEVGSYAGQSPEQSRERRQEEYRRDARSAIADSLRAAGFTPLNDPREDESRL